MSKDPALQFSVMCLDLVEEERKPPTLQYLFYELPFPHLPFTMDRFHVINCWSNGQGSYKQAVKILNPSKTKVFIETGEQAFTLEDPFTPQLMINVFADLKFETEGHYWVQNFMNDRLVLEYPLTVRVVGSAPKPQGPTFVDKGSEKSPPKSTPKASSPSLLPNLPTDEWNIPK